jgi:hypothetical protein
MRASKPALPDLFRPEPILFLFIPSLLPCKSARPAITALFDPDDRCDAAIEAPFPCLKPFGGRSQGGAIPVVLSRSSTFILAAAAAEVTFDALLLLLLLLEPLFTPDDLTLFVEVTLSRNRRSSLKRKIKDVRFSDL